MILDVPVRAMTPENVPWILVSLCLLLPHQVLAQNCDPPNSGIIDSLLETGVEGVVENTMRRPVDVTTSLSRFNISCLTTAERKGKYQFATALVDFTFTGVTQFGSCRNSDSECIALLNIECDDRNDMWIVNDLFISLSVRIIDNFNGTFNIQPRLDCGSCSEQVQFSSLPHDPSTNCFRKFT